MYSNISIKAGVINPSAGGDDYLANNIDESVASYIKQVNSLSIIRHINLLLVASQKHRGAALAAMDGDSVFIVKLSALQRSISYYLSSVILINKQSGFLVSEVELVDLKEDWSRLLMKYNEGMTVVDCYSLHSRLIESLVELIWRLATKANLFSRRDLIAEVDGHSSYEDRDHKALVEIAMRLLPEMIENIAKVRGMATHAAVSGSCDVNYQEKFRGLFQCINYQNLELRRLSLSLCKETLASMPSVGRIMLNDHKLQQLKDLVESKIISKSGHLVSGSVVFDFATEVVEIYRLIVIEGVDRIQEYIERRI